MLKRLTSLNKLVRAPTLKDNMAAEVGMNEKGKDMTKVVEEGEAERAQKRWQKSKWVLLAVNSLLAACGIAFLAMAMMTWEKAWPRADVSLVTEQKLVILITVTSIVTLVFSAVGFYGTLTENRAVLGWWCFLLWPCTGLLISIGYVAYKRQLWNLRAKLGHEWKGMSDNDRLRIQSNLHCCGFQGPLDHAAASAKCYARSLLPGCQGKLYRFSHQSLTTTYIVAFSLLPLYLGAIFASLLCSNHVNKNFGRRTR